MALTRNRKTLWIVGGTHIGILFLLIIIPLIRGCFREPPKEAMFFEVVPAAGPAAPEKIIAPSFDPEPPVEEVPETPVVEQDPPPAEEPTPAPPVEQAPPKKPDPPPKKPKSTLKTPDQIKVNRTRITKNQPKTQPKRPVQTQPRMTADDIKQALGGAVTSDANVHLRYCASLQPSFYSVWHRPAAAPLGTQATATIRVNASGTITYRALTSPSGNTAFDQSVQAALNNAGRLPTPPSVSVNRNITVTFEIQ